MGFLNTGQDTNNSRGLRRNFRCYANNCAQARQKLQPPKTLVRRGTVSLRGTGLITEREGAALQYHARMYTRSVSKFELLPVEILHRVFLEALNPSLADCSLLLAYALRSTHVQLQYLLAGKNQADVLSKIFLCRFFTLQFLHSYEYRFDEHLDAKNTSIPGRLTSVPADYNSLSLFNELLSRGATCGKEIDNHAENLYIALQAGDRRILLTLLNDQTFHPSAKCLELFIQHSSHALEDLNIFQKLLFKGADTSDGMVWRQAFSSHGELNFFEFLLSQGHTPPGAVLSELAI